MPANPMCPKEMTPEFPVKIPIPTTMTTLIMATVTSRWPLAPWAATTSIATMTIAMVKTAARPTPVRRAADQVGTLIPSPP